MVQDVEIRKCSVNNREQERQNAFFNTGYTKLFILPLKKMYTCSSGNGICIIESKVNVYMRRNYNTRRSLLLGA